MASTTQVEWIIDFEKQKDNTTDYTHVCIFQVPKSITDVKPDAYYPQLIGLGPYHHLKPDLNKMQPFKRAVATWAITQFQLVDFAPKLEDVLKQHAPDICACYFEAVKLEDDKLLARMMAVDALFLLGLLDTHAKLRDQDQELMSSESPFADTLKKKMHGNAILNDVLMLENQIPLFVMEEILSKSDSQLPDDRSLNSLVKKFCDERSPIQLDWSSLEVHQHKHFLDALYRTIILQGAKLKEKESPKKDHQKNTKVDKNDKVDDRPTGAAGQPSRCCLCLCCCALIFTMVILLFTKIIKYCLVVPCKKLVDLLLSQLEKHGILTLSTEKNVLIPSVEQLHKAGVKFCTSGGGTRSIKFEKDAFYLPVINFRPTSELVVRNLVAYESLTETDSFPFKRYTELMNAMVDTTEDVQLLIEAKVIGKNELRMVEVLNILNGMGRSLASKDEVIETAIAKANNFYNNSSNVRLGRFMNKYVYSSWKILLFLGSTFLLGLQTFQTVCGVYHC